MVAADTLARYGTRAALAESRLIEMTADDTRRVEVRDTAAYALGRVGGQRALQALVAVVDRDDSLGRCAKRAIEQIRRRQ
jgi:HEAT repeat protein